ncbi:MAG: hypothetical protein ACO1SX_17865 [Actinomycetota bacterium]
MLSDPEIARTINEKFVACWDTVRPVPKVTIDFGNGKSLVRTLAGNTVISICLPDGRPLDAFPGVYTPADFKAQLAPTLDLFASLNWKQDRASQVSAQVGEWHRARFVEGVQKEGRRTTLSKAAVESPLLQALGIRGMNAMSFGAGPSPSAPEPDAAATPSAPMEPMLRTTTSKAAVQSVVLDRLSTVPPAAVPSVRPVPPASPDPLADPRGAFAALSSRIEDASKRAATIRELRTNLNPATAAQPKTPEQLGKEAVEADSRINVQAIRPAVHLWFMANGALPNQRQLRDAMYKDLLHVPVDDPYLGLTAALVPGTPNGMATPPLKPAKPIGAGVR